MVSHEEIKKRQAQLFGMGMAKTMYGFAFRGYYVDAWSIENMPINEWDLYLASIYKKNEELKAELNLVQGEIAKSFVYYLKSIVPPELIQRDHRDIINAVMYHIQTVTEWAEEELEKCQ